MVSELSILQREQLRKLEEIAATSQQVYWCIMGSANESEPASMMAQVCRVLVRTTQFEAWEDALWAPKKRNPGHVRPWERDTSDRPSGTQSELEGRHEG